MMCYSLALVKSPCVYLFVVGLGVVGSCAARDPSVYSAGPPEAFGAGAGPSVSSSHLSILHFSNP